MGGLGRRAPTDDDHIRKHPLRMEAIAPEPFIVNKTLKLPDLRDYWRRYDQGAEGACVGFGSSWAMTILNKKYYAARKLYLEAQKVDEWHDTPPEQGTSVRAAMDVLRKVGHWRMVYNRHTRRYEEVTASMVEGIEANKWATTVDEVRACIKAGTPVVIGVAWYSNFDHPEYDQSLNKWWIGRGSLGRLRGGHCVCLYGALDRHQAFQGINNWGEPVINNRHELLGGYPRFLLPYATFQRLLQEDGEATLVVDRVGAPVVADTESGA